MDDVLLLGDSDEVVVTFQNSAGTEVTDVVDAVEKVMAEVGPNTHGSILQCIMPKNGES